MFMTAAAIALIATQAPVASVMPEAQTAIETDAAFDELAAGQTEAAIAKLEQADTSQPVVLINLGTAYLSEGRVADAREAFQAAANADERYDVELADGSWIDSREVARIALERLDRTSFAAR